MLLHIILAVSGSGEAAALHYSCSGSSPCCLSKPGVKCLKIHQNTQQGWCFQVFPTSLVTCLMLRLYSQDEILSHPDFMPLRLSHRSIRCLRNIIHWNLITAFILRNATWFIVQLTMSPEVHESNVVGNVWCIQNREFVCVGYKFSPVHQMSGHRRQQKHHFVLFSKTHSVQTTAAVEPYEQRDSLFRCLYANCSCLTEGFLSQVWCRLVTASFNYFHSTNFFWMFGEGCYLHTAIVLTYSTDKLRKWMFICIGWCECRSRRWRVLRLQSFTHTHKTVIQPVFSI